MENIRSIIENAWENRDLLKLIETRDAIRHLISQLDSGKIRVAEKLESGIWQVNDWVKKGVLMYFPIQEMKTMEVGIFEFHDKIPMKKKYAQHDVRVVPHAIARY